MLLYYTSGILGQNARLSNGSIIFTIYFAEKRAGSIAFTLKALL